MLLAQPQPLASATRLASLTLTFLIRIKLPTAMSVDMSTLSSDAHEKGHALLPKTVQCDRRGFRLENSSLAAALPK